MLASLSDARDHVCFPDSDGVSFQREQAEIVFVITGSLLVYPINPSRVIDEVDMELFYTERYR